MKITAISIFPEYFSPLELSLIGKARQQSLIDFTTVNLRDDKRFPNGPWCKVGDFILARPNSGTRLKIHGREFRIINDDSVEAVVEDPRGISRA